MNKIRIRIGACLLIILFLCLPKVAFMIEDHYTIYQNYVMANNQYQDVLKEYPLIAQLYQQSYSEDDVLIDYVVKEIDTYNEEKQKEARLIQSYFSREINQLIDNHLMTLDLLECQDYFDVTFGTITDRQSNNGGIYSLDLLYRLHSKDDKDIYFTMDKVTQKITSFSCQQKKLNQLNQEEIQALLQDFIHYLELDDIDDWYFNQNGYESSKAKIRVYYQTHQYGQSKEYKIGISLLYPAISSQNLIIDISEQ